MFLISKIKKNFIIKKIIIVKSEKQSWIYHLIFKPECVKNIKCINFTDRSLFFYRPETRGSQQHFDFLSFLFHIFYSMLSSVVRDRV